jgi:hypothetical protein
MSLSDEKRTRFRRLVGSFCDFTHDQMADALDTIDEMERERDEAKERWDLAATSWKARAERAEADAAALWEALRTLRIDCNRLCGRQLGGTYEDDARKSIREADVALERNPGAALLARHAEEVAAERKKWMDITRDYKPGWAQGLQALALQLGWQDRGDDVCPATWLDAEMRRVAEEVTRLTAHIGRLESHVPNWTEHNARGEAIDTLEAEVARLRARVAELRHVVEVHVTDMHRDGCACYCCAALADTKGSP